MTSIEETQLNHRSARGERGGLKCDTCGNEWPCRDNLMIALATARSHASTMYESNRAENATLGLHYERLRTREHRLFLVPLLCFALLEFGILIGLWVAR